MVTIIKSIKNQFALIPAIVANRRRINISPS